MTVARGGDGPVRSRHNQRLGASAEAQVASWYVGAGYEVVARNWRCRDGEIDLILRRRGELVFCEVKARTSTRFGLPAEAVTLAKQRRLRLLAARYLAESRRTSDGGDGSAAGSYPRSGGVRFDVASVLAGRVEVIEGAF